MCSRDSLVAVAAVAVPARTAVGTGGDSMDAVVVAVAAEGPGGDEDGSPAAVSGVLGCVSAAPTGGARRRMVSARSFCCCCMDSMQRTMVSMLASHLEPEGGRWLGGAGVASSCDISSSAVCVSASSSFGSSVNGYSTV